MIYLKQIVYSLTFLFINYVVAYIPIWHIRKLFYLIFGMHIGRNSRIHMKCTVINPWGITIGTNTIINEQCFLDGRGGLVIGNDTSISVQSMILTASHDRRSRSFEYYESGVVIGNNVWMGARAMVLDNSKVEDGCIISAGSSLKGNTEAGYIYTGVPARKARARELEGPYTISYKNFFR